MVSPSQSVSAGCRRPGEVWDPDVELMVDAHGSLEVTTA